MIKYRKQYLPSKNFVSVVWGRSAAAIFLLRSAEAMIGSALVAVLLFSAKQMGHTYATASEMFLLPLNKAHSW
jgi:hypothetical protein